MSYRLAAQALGRKLEFRHETHFSEDGRPTASRAPNGRSLNPRVNQDRANVGRTSSALTPPGSTERGAEDGGSVVQYRSL